ncbi:MAG TPA: lysophospholipid acyltransferase family protein [Phnomibacter sp.]|nr:lysophospholipid acyltransferase family protein [Phnomibacter sp.]
MYYLLLAVIYLLSLLPMFVLYALGDIIGFFLFGVVGYRKKVVLKNLRNAFPEKTEKEIDAIAQKFYSNFMDLWMETIKFLTMTPAGIKRRMSGDNSILFKYHAEGKSCQVIGGHTMNWELLNGYYPLTQPLQFIAVYMQISNPAMERLFKKLRCRFGSLLIPAKEVRYGLDKYFQQQYLYVLGADQSPTKPAEAYWVNFLNQPTGFPTGPAKHTIKQQQPIVFSYIEKTGCGKYVVHLEPLFENLEGVTPEEITLAFVRRLEHILQQHPDNYLWTHKRWKHAWKPEYAGNWIDTAPLPVAEIQ